MTLFTQQYNDLGDFCAILVCIVHIILSRTSYTEKKQNLRLFYMANALTMVAAFFNIIYHMVLDFGFVQHIWIYYFMNSMVFVPLAFNFVYMCIYVRNLVQLEGKSKKLVNISIGIIFVVYFVEQVTSHWTHLGVWFDENGVEHTSTFLGNFSIYYIICSILIFSILYKHKNRFITKVRNGILYMMLMAFILMGFQLLFHQTSMTCFAFTFPITATLFLFHHNTYDAKTGMLDHVAFEAYIRDLSKKDFGIIYLQLKDMSEIQMKSLSEIFIHFNENYFASCCTFRFQMGKMMAVYPKKVNLNLNERLQRLFADFQNLYEEYRIDYKVIVIDSNSELQSGNDYLGLIKHVGNNMDWNEIYTCKQKDIDRYQRIRLIENALMDIQQKDDLNDERVKVYCQPVLNTEMDQFTTAEALMRIVLPEQGMIFPDEFIPIAEEDGYIHILSKIILNKTCIQIKHLQSEGYHIDRVSVNFSMTELHSPDFCHDVISIIEQNGVENSQIAIELTESRNEQDYELVKRVMTELHSLGIKFYLDDFGTGYSNVERIIGLPFDIIKFDRSLTIMAGQDEQSRYLVGSFSDIFDNSQYQILFEGVEDEADEESCKEMNALYLQGYKYSKPIPIEYLVDFLKKKKGK